MSKNDYSIHDPCRELAAAYGAPWSPKRRLAYAIKMRDASSEGTATFAQWNAEVKMLAAEVAESSGGEPK